jgi:hypothetical protein
MIADMDALIENLVFTADTVCAPNRSRKWNDEELQFLRDSMGYLTEAEIGAILGRPANGVHLKRERLGMLPTSQTPGWLSVEQVRLQLGLKDGRRISSWVKRGFVKGHILGGPRKICMVHEISLRRFILNPMNWPWFDPKRVRDPWLRRLLERQAQRWGNEWLTPRQASQICGLDIRDIGGYVKKGRLTAVHTWNLDGRHTEKGRWANYFVLRSEIDRMRIYGRGDALRSCTPAGLEWIRKALAMGWNATWIGRSMKRDSQTVRNWIDQFHLGERPRNMGRPKGVRNKK